MSDDMRRTLEHAGITSQDYPDILGQDPLVNGDSAVKTPRFVPAGDPLWYLPPLKPNDPVLTTTITIGDSSTETTGLAYEETYKVGLSLSQQGGFFEVAKGKLTDKASWQWTNKTSQSSTVGTSDTASFTVGGPAYDYPTTEPHLLQVYKDTIYKTFAFAFIPVDQIEIAVKGTIKTASGDMPPPTEITLVENGVKHRTLSNARGEFAFFGHLTGPFTVEVPGAGRQVIPQLQPRTLEFQIR
jgi:hypothetical protein